MSKGTLPYLWCTSPHSRRPTPNCHESDKLRFERAHIKRAWARVRAYTYARESSLGWLCDSGRGIGVAQSKAAGVAQSRLRVGVKVWLRGWCRRHAAVGGCGVGGTCPRPPCRSALSNSRPPPHESRGRASSQSSDSPPPRRRTPVRGPTTLWHTDSKTPLTRVGCRCGMNPTAFGSLHSAPHC